MNNELYYIDDAMSEKPSNVHFSLHEHDDYEIYLFLNGDAKYIVEGSTYNLKPYDIILIKKNEMHRVYHNSSTLYKRIVINVLPEFFRKNNCREYEKYFLDPESGNKIDASVVRSAGIYDAFMRLKKYTNNFKNVYTPVANGIITEILYLISTVDVFLQADDKNTVLQEIISYINSNYHNDITLEALSNKFYINKYHLCHIFRRETGLTVHQYITRIRISKAKELERGGTSPGKIAGQVGFKTYSAFYRAYVNVVGKSPTSQKNRL